MAAADAPSQALRAGVIASDAEPGAGLIATLSSVEFTDQLLEGELRPVPHSGYSDLRRDASSAALTRRQVGRSG